MFGKAFKFIIIIIMIFIIIIISGASLSNSTGFKEVTSDSVCTQYSSHDCDKY